MPVDDSPRRLWRRKLRVTGILMAVWFLVTFGVSFFARQLSFSFFGWPFSFWMASQGALVIYVVLIACCVHYMGRLDREHGVDEEG